MAGPRVLVIDGNRAETRARQVAAGGHDSGAGYVETLLGLLPDLHCDVVRPADGEVTLPSGVSLEDYDGVAMTGSALNVYDGGPHIERQIELAGAVFAAGVPFFGSCWGLQVAVTAAGGVVRPNPRGREFGFGRRIQLTAAGREHAMFAGKAEVFEAVTVHRDEIATLPPGSTLLATNEMGLQAAEIRHGRGVFWGVQYHPEYSYAEIAATAVRYGQTLIIEGLFADAADMDRFVAELRALDANPDSPALNWRLGLGPAIQDRKQKLAEIDNWLRREVLAGPHSGRAPTLAR
jgi:GMP synthase (glutamine-hydrolysing)